MKRLDDLSTAGIGLEWEYISSTNHEDQCWHFCHYRNTSITITPYGAEMIYPLVTNRSAIVMGYQDRKDLFLDRMLSSYGFPSDQHIVIVNASNVLEDYNKICYERWMHPLSEQEEYYHHKCMSYYLDQHFVEETIAKIHEFRRLDCEYLQNLK
jgi:hypothetical protein